MATPQLWPPTAPSALDYFRTLVASDTDLPLLEAAASVAQDHEPQLDVEAFLAEMELLAQTVCKRLPVDATCMHKLQLLNHYFFRELGFSGNLNNYYEPENSHLHQVLRRRRGIPITLALLYTELAQHMGLKARGVSFPGHFLVKVSLTHGSQRGDVVMDPFSGLSLNSEMLEEMLLPYKRQHHELEQVQIPLEFFLRPASARDILARLLRNLKEIYRSRQDWTALLAVSHRLVTLLPEVAEERRDRAVALEALGCWSQAAHDIQSYLTLLGDRGAGPQFDALRARLSALRGGATDPDQR
jgi:regulator of sirC expression with transglutaminase-like and TPR domain